VWLSKTGTVMAVVAVVSPTALTHPLKPAESVSERSTYPRYAFPDSPIGQRVLATNLLPFTGPGLRPTMQNSS